MSMTVPSRIICRKTSLDQSSKCKKCKWSVASNVQMHQTSSKQETCEFLCFNVWILNFLRLFLSAGRKARLSTPRRMPPALRHNLLVAPTPAEQPIFPPEFSQTQFSQKKTIFSKAEFRSLAQITCVETNIHIIHFTETCLCNASTVLFASVGTQIPGTKQAQRLKGSMI